MNKYPRIHQSKTNLVKGGIDPIQRALSQEELDDQLRRDIEEAEKNAAERIAAAKKACEERRARKALNASAMASPTQDSNEEKK